MSNQTNHDSKKQITYIGRVNFRSDAREFGIKTADVLRHIYCLGTSGSGKSTLLLNMARQDIEQGRACCVIDPHGDLAETLIQYVPETRIKDVIYLNPADEDFPIGYNPLSNVHPKYHHLVASGLIGTFKKVWFDSWGRRMEHILRFSILTLLQYQNATLLDVHPLLTDPSFRNEILSKVQNPHILAFWNNEYAKYSSSFRSEAIAPILNKLGLLVASTPLRNMVGQQTRTLKLQEVIDTGKILIINLSKGMIGEEACGLIGSMILSGIQLAALHRARMPAHARKPYFIYVDEMHSFITLSLADMLSGSRKYGIGLFLTHQYLEQIPDEIRAAILGNTGTLISFRISAQDATYLSKEFFPVFNEYDIIHLPAFHFYIRLMIDGTTSQPFSAVTLPLPVISDTHKDRAREIIESSRKHYGRPKAVVEQEALPKARKEEEQQGGLFE